MLPRCVVHTHTHHGGIKQLQSFERRREWIDATRDKLTVGIGFHTRTLPTPPPLGYIIGFAIA